MKFNELTLSKHRQTRRSGRGIAAGRGKTAGRGTKGQGSRTGSSKKPGFEGGQNPLMQRLPKLPGFKSHREVVETVNLDDLSLLKGKTADAVALFEAGLVLSQFSKIKVLSSGKLTKALSVNLPQASSTAINLIESAGGSFTPTPRLARPANPDPAAKASRRAKPKSAARNATK